MVKDSTAAADNGPVELRPRTVAGGRTDTAGVRWTLEQMHSELAGTPELGRVRNALAIALMELDRAHRQSTTIITDDLGRSRYFPWTTKRS
jgi:hypothetical protein